MSEKTVVLVDEKNNEFFIIDSYNFQTTGEDGYSEHCYLIADKTSGELYTIDSEDLCKDFRFKKFIQPK